MNEKELHAKLQESGLPGIGELDESTADPFVMVDPDALVAAVRFLHDDPACAMEMLHLVTATEREQGIEVAYHLCSYSHHHSLTVKTSVARPEGAGVEWLPEVPSVAGVYSSADWHEREQWDLLGVTFTGHPDPRRILLPEEWIGHPLRKQYVYPSEHGGIPLELDAVPIYERDGEPPEEPHEPRPPGTPLIQPPAARSDRPHAGGHAPAKEGDS